MNSRGFNNRASNSKGFTLLEVMVALSVFAIAAVALLNAQSNQTKTNQRLEEKTYAHWVALNYLEELRLGKLYPETGESRSEGKMAGRDWIITRKVQATPTPNVRLLIISVAPKSDKNDQEVGAKIPEPVSIVTGFLSRPSQGASSDAPNS